MKGMVKKMNKVCLMGRLTREPDTRYSQGDDSLMITSYTLAVDRIRRKEGEATADFIRCVAFGRQAELDVYKRQILLRTLRSLTNRMYQSARIREWHAYSWRLDRTYISQAVI